MFFEIGNNIINHPHKDYAKTIFTFPTRKKKLLTRILQFLSSVQHHKLIVYIRIELKTNNSYRVVAIIKASSVSLLPHSQHSHKSIICLLFFCLANRLDCSNILVAPRVFVIFHVNYNKVEVWISFGNFIKNCKFSEKICS